MSDEGEAHSLETVMKFSTEAFSVIDELLADTMEDYPQDRFVIIVGLSAMVDGPDEPTLGLIERVKLTKEIEVLSDGKRQIYSHLPSDLLERTLTFRRGKFYLERVA